MSIVIFLVFAITALKTTNCDWIEITQTKINKPETQTDVPQAEYASSIPKPIISTTLSTIYEDVMKTSVTTPSSFHTNKSNIGISDVTSSRSMGTHVPHKQPHRKQNDSNDDWGFFKSLVKSVQDILLQRQDNSVQSKIAVLTNLRDTILYNIDDKISKLWEPDANREARGYKDEHHMDFPSNEGALMTIGFLTFAVFLIKLVLKLIYALKYKQQYYYTTTTTPATVFIRRQRDLYQEENERIIKLIEQFRYN